MRHATAAPIRVHWFALAAVLIALVGVLVVEGYLRHLYRVADDRPSAPGPATAVPAWVSQGGPVIDAREGQRRTATPREHTIALTFDDGPDPTWTPAILDVLARHHVHATFFVIGTQALDHPDLMARIRDEGHEVGVHTLTHADLSTSPAWQQRLEVHAAQAIVAATAERSPTLLRPPFVSTNDAVDNRQWAVVEWAATEGYLAVLSTLDSDDWSRPGVERIVEAATPTGSAGAVVLLHDGGGDRSQTVAALDRLMPRLAAAGFQADTVSNAVGLPGPTPAVKPADRLWAAGLVGGVRAAEGLVRLLGIALALAGALTALRVVGVLVAARRHHRSSRHQATRLAATGAAREPVSVILPAYNESLGIEAAVRSVVASEHPVHVVVVDDGSTDGTADLVQGLALDAVTVVRQPNAGKPAALNAGLRACGDGIVVMIDGDTVIEPTTVDRLAARFDDPAVGAVSGNAKVANRRGILGRWQHIEYVVGFNLDRRLFDLAECMPTVPGAVGAFRREALDAVGGVPDETLAEDTDLTMALCRAGWRVVYEPSARAWTEAPQTLGALWRQRYRWCYGTLQAMWKHRGAVVQRGQSGKLGRRGLLYLLVFQTLLPMLAPAVDVFTVYGVAFLDPRPVLGAWLGFLALQLGMAVYAFVIDREPLGPLWSLPLQQVVYRQLMYLVVLQSVFSAVAGTRLRWQRMDRYGSLPTSVRGSAHPPAASVGGRG